jgi:hypothetical protein
MTFRKTTLRLAAASVLVATAGIGVSAVFAQAAPSAKEKAEVATTRGPKAVADPTKLQPIPQDYHPKKTQWGEPDFTGTWPIDSIASIFFQRPDRYGNRFYLNQEELDAREKEKEGSLKRYEEEAKQGKIGMGHWVESDASGSQTALLVEPANGKLPPMTPWAQEMYKNGRSSWNQHPYDWTADFDTWDRCVTRGFPASMLPFRYNNGIRVKQAPGVVVIDLEMIHDSRVIPVAANKAAFQQLLKTRWPATVRTWMGQSLGYWEDDNTLVIETTNIKTGDSVTGDHIARGPSPLNMATMGVPPNNTIPTSDQAKVVERLTMTGPNSIMYEMTYSDPKVFTAPFTARLPWTRNEDYGFYEYACFEGDVQVRNYINSSRAQRGLKTSEIGDPDRVGAEPVAAVKPATQAVGG